MRSALIGSVLYNLQYIMLDAIKHGWGAPLHSESCASRFDGCIKFNVSTNWLWPYLCVKACFKLNHVLMDRMLTNVTLL